MLEKNLKMSITTAYFPSENRKIVESGFFSRGGLVCERCRWQIQRAKRAQQRSEFRSIIHCANEIQGTALRVSGSC